MHGSRLHLPIAIEEIKRHILPMKGTWEKQIIKIQASSFPYCQLRIYTAETLYMCENHGHAEAQIPAPPII